MIISVASGKGGTGKTLVSTNLALSLAQSYKVRFLDCDVEEPDAHIFLKPNFTQSGGVSIPVPEVDEEKCNYCGKCAEVCAFNAIAVVGEKFLLFPELCHGCGACSYLCPEDALREVGREIGTVEMGSSGNMEFFQGKLNVGEPMAPPITRKVKEKVDANSVTIIDVPPGTSCPMVEAVEKSDFCLLVTEPTPFGLSDLSLAVEVVKKLNMPCGVIINRAGAGDSRVEEYCARENIPIMLEIPLDTEIAYLYSRGIPLIEGIPKWREDFLKIFDKVKENMQG